MNYSSDLNFTNSRPSASNFKIFSWSPEHFFLTVGQNNFGNKIPLPTMKKLSQWPMNSEILLRPEFEKRNILCSLLCISKGHEKTFSVMLFHCYLIIGSIFFPTLFDLLWEILIEKMFWNSRLKVENCTILDHYIEQFIWTVFAFLTYSWTFLRSDIHNN